jgi:complement component 1 Q subcomponent-binding protein, mitochondrial
VFTQHDANYLPSRIKVEFTITDMHEMDDEELGDFDEDTALSDEDFDTPKRTINQSGTSGGKVDVVAEDSIAPSDRDGAEDDDIVPTAFPLNLHVTITKPGDKAILVRAAARDGQIVVENINYFPETKLIDPVGPEDSAAAQSLYAGPPFENLDTDLQMMFENYLEERGVNTELATMVADYVTWKEQREYVDWLQSK